MSNISQWSTSAASNNTAPPNGFPEGQAPSTVNDCAREVMAAVARQFGDTQGTIVSGGTSNAYAITTASVNAALADQGLIVFQADRANTGAATLNVDSLGAKSIQANGVNLVSGALVADSIYAVAYNVTNDTYDLLNALLGLEVGVDVQAWNAALDDISGLAVTDGNIIVGDGTNWIAESGLTARTSLGAADSDLSEVDFSGLTAIEGNALNDAEDGWLIDDNGVTKRMSFQGSGFVVVTVAGTTETLANADLNKIRYYTNAAGCAVTINTGVGVIGNWIVLIQNGAGQVTTAGTAARNGGNGTDTRTQYSVITLLCVAVNTWIVLGDAS